MSRASEFTLCIILIQASLGFVTASGMFSHNYMGSLQNNATYTITDLEEYSQEVEGDVSFTDELMTMARWGLEAVFIGARILFAVVFIFWDLVTVFKVPMILAAFIQAGVYYVYAVWYSQYKSGKGWRMYE